MTRRYRLGVIGFAHMHVNELVDRLRATGRCDLVAVADTVPLVPSRTEVEGSRRANLARALATPERPRGFDDWRAMLDEMALDVAIFCPEIARHVAVAEALAARKVHMLTEKPLAASGAEARRMAAVAAAAGVALVTNWPVTWRPALRLAKALVDDGAIGPVTGFRWRNNASLGPLAAGSLHPGDTVVSGEVPDADKAAEWWHQASEGGGALLDYCCYGALLATWFLGPPREVRAQMANLMSPGDAEDNAALLLRHEGAMATIEASWTTLHNGGPNGPVLTGPRGTLVVDGARVLLYRTKGAAAPDEVLEGEALPDGEADIGTAMLRHLDGGAPLHATLGVDLNVAVADILGAARVAAETGTAQRF